MYTISLVKYHKRRLFFLFVFVFGFLFSIMTATYQTHHRHITRAPKNRFKFNEFLTVYMVLLIDHYPKPFAQWSWGKFIKINIWSRCNFEILPFRRAQTKAVGIIFSIQWLKCVRWTILLATLKHSLSYWVSVKYFHIEINMTDLLSKIEHSS